MWNRIGCLAALVLLSSGCSSMQIATQSDPNAAFDTYRTWSWMKLVEPKAGDPRVDSNRRLDQIMRETIERRMAERGFVQETALPDLYLDYQVSTEDRVNSQVITNYFDESFYPEFELDLPGIQDTYRHEWEEGTLLLLVFDARSRKLIWRGLAQSEVNTQGPVKDSRKKIDEAVSRLVRRIPR